MSARELRTDNGKRNMSAGRRIDKLLHGKSKDQQIKALTMLIDMYKENTSYIHMDRYIEAVNRKVALEKSNGISGKKPMEEGLMKGGELAAGRALSGMGGC